MGEGCLQFKLPLHRVGVSAAAHTHSTGAFNPTEAFGYSLAFSVLMDEQAGNDQEFPSTLHREPCPERLISYKELEALRGKLVTPG